MTAATVKHANVSGLYASPATIIGRGLQDSPLQVIKGTIEIATTSQDDVGDIVLLCELPWEAKVHAITIFNDDLDSHSTPTLAVDVGIYSQNNAGTVTVALAAAYGSAITTLQSANTLGVNVAFEQRDINAMAATVFTDSGLSTRTAGDKAILGLTVTTVSATAAAGTLSFVVSYTM